MSTPGTIEADGDRRRLRFERRFDAEIADVWSALIDPERLARWLAATSFANGRVEIAFDGGDVVTGAVLAWEPPLLVEYEWRYPGETESVVRFELAQDGDGTLLVLEHRRLGTDQSVGYAAGWHAHLDGLAAELDGRPSTWDERFDAWLPHYRTAATRDL